MSRGTPVTPFPVLPSSEQRCLLFANLLSQRKGYHAIWMLVVKSTSVENCFYKRRFKEPLTTTSKHTQPVLASDMIPFPFIIERPANHEVRYKVTESFFLLEHLFSIWKSIYLIVILYRDKANKVLQRQTTNIKLLLADHVRRRTIIEYNFSSKLQCVCFALMTFSKWWLYYV